MNLAFADFFLIGAYLIAPWIGLETVLPTRDLLSPMLELKHARKHWANRRAGSFVATPLLGSTSRVVANLIYSLRGRAVPFCWPANALQAWLLLLDGCQLPAPLNADSQWS
jgi:hypothetical protein